MLDFTFRHGVVNEVKVILWSASCGDMESGGVAFSIGECHDLLGAPWPEVRGVCEGCRGALAAEASSAVFWGDEDVEVDVVVP